MTRALAAHLRLLETLPRRTHYRQYLETPHQGRRYGAVLPQALIDAYRELKASGLEYRLIRETLCIGSLTLRRLSKLAA